MIRPHYVPLYQSICHSERVSDLKDHATRFFYTLLLTHADSWGWMDARPRVLFQKVWSLYGAISEVEPMLSDLARVGLVVRYGDNLLAFPDWEEKAGKVGKLDRRAASQFEEPPVRKSSPAKSKSSPSSRARAGAQFGSANAPATSRLGFEEGDTGEDRAPPTERAQAKGDHPECIQHWEAEWTRTRLGTKATVEAREGAAVAWMLKHADPPEVRRRMTAILEDADPWIAQNASLPILKSKWDRFAVSIRPNREPTGLDAARSLIAKQRAKANGTTGP